ncbi:hypothetical protein LYSHEL_08970 [Lysobacter helvus]|uniref:Autotransporter domain-containing protein n=2 Tax=Lysobacteraceae TaxID=32033 RepID=A0ABM7Q3K6_9GAMM|nr:MULTISPECIES: hypothetical protein [Lysobacter]BCT91873.1 hypothetical protein LYSCAS_08970 [Lysobacter caseinilyticus]BCT95026.1 hypothetical protein LYSHEL_08970 [Lysobacter helvus]
MKIERNRARKGAVVARRYSVSPVTRAIRSVLTVSTAALAFSGTGLALASAPVHTTQAPAFAAQHADLSQHAAFAPSVPVVDLTLVRDADLPASVVGGDLGLTAALSDTDLQYAGPVGPGGGDAFDRVFDIANVQSFVAPGPGGGSGGLDDQVFFSYSNPGNFPGNWYVSPHGNNITVTSNTGLADGWFVSLGGIDELDADWTMDITGYTWAAGVEMEVAAQGYVLQTGDISATATGAYGQAMGVYVSAGTDATISNDGGSIGAHATGAYGIAAGLFGYAVSGTSDVGNNGLLVADANNSGTAIGVTSTSVYGTALGANNGTMSVSGGDYGTGVGATSFYGTDARAMNNGAMTVSGGYSAIGLDADAAYGNAMASNGDSATVQVTSLGYALGMQATAGGNATANNTGNVSATALFGNAIGMQVLGDTASGTNADGGTLTVSGGYVAIGIDAEGARSANATNGGTLDVDGSFAAMGLYAGANGTAMASNTGTITVDSIDANAFGLLAYGGGNATTFSDGSLAVTSAYGDALGLQAISVAGDANATNLGTLKVSGDNAKGLYAISYGTGTAHAENTGTINAGGVNSAYGMYALSVNGDASIHNGGSVGASADGAAIGAFVGGYNASVKNDGDIAATSNSFISEGVLAVGAYTDITNSGSVSSSGLVAFGLDSEGAYGAGITNSRDVTATGYFRAYGLYATSSGGNVAIANTGNVDVDAFGVAYGAFANGAGAITVTNDNGIDARSEYTDALGVLAVGGAVNVTNTGIVHADGYATGAGIYAAGGFVTVDNDGGNISANARVGDGFAVGVLAAGGDVAVNNSAFIGATGAYATGIDIRAAYAATATNNVGGTVQVDGSFATGISVRSSNEGQAATATNDGTVNASGTASVSGIEAVSRAFQGTGVVTNNGSVNINAPYAGVAQGLVAAGDSGAIIHNTQYGTLNVTGGSAAYGALALSADVEGSFTNDGRVIVNAVSRGGTAFGAVVQGNTGIATVDNTGTGLIVAQGDNAYGAYATGLFSHASVDNSGVIYAFANAGNSFGALAYSYNNLATTSNAGLLVSSAAGASVGMEALTLFGDASITNDGTLFAGGGTRARGEIARSLFGTATTSNDDTIIVRSNGGAYGMWSRADYGVADATNNGDVDVQSYYSRAYGVLSGGYYGATLTNTIDGKVDARGYTNAIAAAAYSNYGDVTIVNDGSLSASALGLSYGIQALAAFDATVTNTGTISSISSAAVGDGIYANATNVDVTNTGDIVAKGDYWSAGIEGRGDAVSILSSGGSVDAYVYDGNAFGLFARANDDATVRNNSDMWATAEHGNAYGEFAIAGNGIGDHAITTNGGDVIVRAYDGAAYGVLAAGTDVDSTNSGTLDVQGTLAATGMVGLGNTHSILINHGDIDARASADGSTAIGLYAYAVGFARGVNDGTIYAHANNGNALGMDVYGDTAVVQNLAGGDVSASVYQGMAIGSYSWGTISNTVTNAGVVRASTGDGNATGIMALGYGVVQVNASATSQVTASGNGSGTFTTGILADGDVAGVDNAGGVAVNGTGARSVGIQVFGDTSATINTTGIVNTSAGKYSNTSVVGLLADATGAVSVTNGGIVTGAGGYDATGILAHAYDGDVAVSNTSDGTIQVTDAFNRRVTGVYAASSYGDVSIDNAGTISAGGTFTFPKYNIDSTTEVAMGANAYAAFGNASITNSGTVNVLAGVYGAGLVAGSYEGDASVVNTGTVKVTVNGDFAIGLGAQSDDGNASVSNVHDLTVTNSYSVAVGGAASGDSASASNGGNLTVSGVSGAVGLAAHGSTQADVLNDGSVQVTQLQSGNSLAATGLLAYASVGDAIVTNHGSVSVNAYDRAVGIDASAYGNTTVTNANDVTVFGNYGYAIGVMARDLDGAGGDLTAVTNSGQIHAGSGSSWAEGVFAEGEKVNVTNALGGSVEATGLHFAAGIDTRGDTVAIANAGDVSAQAFDSTYSMAMGIEGFANDALAITNTGHVDATSPYGDAKGVAAYGYGTVLVDNRGSIAAGAYGYAMGIGAEGLDGASVTVRNSGDITATSDDSFADGIFSRGGAVSITNTHAIVATATQWAAGMEVDADAITIANGGDITATSTGNGQASGIYAYGLTSMAIGNTGHVIASAVDGNAFGISAYGEYATTAVTNGGSLNARSTNGNATGVNAYGDATTVANAGTIDALGHDAAFGIQAGAYGTVSVSGNGTIHATATQYALGVGADGDIANVNVGGTTIAAADQAIGIRASGNTSASVNTTGTVTATGIASAFGVQVDSDASSFHNTNVVRATATGDDAFAAGALVFGATASVNNGATLSATATGHDSQAIGAFVLGGDVSLANTATITATSTSGAAVGALVGAKYGDGTVTNSGTITATGHTGNTVGLVAQSAGDVTVNNTGTINAIDAGYAIAMGLYADGTSVVTNTGTIVATSSVENSVAIAGGDGVEDIRNAGMLNGALVLGDGNDVLTNQNHGTWIVRGHGTDFGGGDDRIVNAAGGTIVMNNAAISLGGNSGAGNVFTNAGLVSVNGDSSIDLGTGLSAAPLMQSNLHAIAAAPVSVLNPIAFTNNGTISFLDGAPDDTLTIYGDFAGQGALNVDVSLLNRTSDMLYIEGNVSDGTKQALNVRVLDLPKTVAGLSIPVVSVTGESKAGEFTAGTFSIDRVLLNANNFVNLKVGVTERINTANATADLFNITVAMDGVNDTGSLAGDIATGAQSLMTTQVGTFRQRMGVFSRMGDSDTGAWVRVFHDKGTITPQFTLDNMPQNGQFGFEQTNSGVEAGVNAYVTDGFFIGATLGKSEGKQSLDNGFGSDKLKGDTAGLYMTYLSPNGFYADVSYRWMHFDADLTSAGGKQESGGDVGAFNVEAGWNVWTSASGLKLVPQVQYTRSEVSNVDILHGDLASFEIHGGTSSRGRAGLELEQSFTTASGANWTPYGALSVIREFKGEQGFTIADTFTGHTSTQGTSGMLEVGANVKMGNLDIFGGLNWTDGGAFDSILGGQVGLRYTW